MKLQKFKVDRLEGIKGLFYDLLPTVWVHDQKTIQKWYRKLDLRFWLNSIEWDCEIIIRGYYQVYTFEDDHFLTHEQVFGDEK